MKYRAAAVQIAPKKGDLAANIARVASACERAAEAGADLAVFPETCLTGYFLEGGVGDVAIPVDELAQRTAKATSASIEAVIGFYERSGGAIYNSAAHLVLDSGKAEIAHVHRKFFLPTYGVFDEERFVSRGKDISTYSTRLGKFALLICEDIWHAITPMIAALKGAETIIAIAASPGRGFGGEKIDNLDSYHRILRAISEEHGVWCINSMLVGFEGGKGFTGGSAICDPSGRFVAEGPVCEEHMMIANIDLDEIQIARQRSPLLDDLRTSLEDISRELQEVIAEAQCKQT